MTEPREVHLPVTRRARLAVSGPEARAGSVEEIWILLHGYRQLAPRFLRHFRAIYSERRLLVAPEGLSRFYLEGKPGPHRGGDPVGASWMTRVDRETEILDYLEYLDRTLEWASEEAGGSVGDADLRLRVLGFSQGVHTAARWVALGRAFDDPAIRQATRFILWGASLPGDLPTDADLRFRDLGGISLVRGDDDSLRNREAEDREEALLDRWEIEFEVRSHPGRHRIDGALLREMAEG